MASVEHSTEPAASSGRRAGVLCLLFAAVGWGLNWPLIKLLLAEWPPLFARGTAGLCAAVALFAFAALRRESLGVPRGSIGRLGWFAFTNVFAFMGFSAIALIWLTPGEGALLVYTMPLWAMLLAWPILGTKPTGRSVAALALCAVGVVFLFHDSFSTLGATKLPGIAFALAAAVIFALGAVTSGAGLGVPPVVATAWQVLLGSAVMVVLSFIFEHPQLSALSRFGLMSWVYMAIVPMALCYLAWFQALKRLSPSTATTGSLLVPVVGVLSSAPIAGATLGVGDFVSLILVMSGVALVAVKPGPRRTT